MSKLNTETQLPQTIVSGSAFLSGKCEEDFINFYTKNRKYKNDLKQFKQNIQASIIVDACIFCLNIQASIIVDWLDSVSINYC